MANRMRTSRTMAADSQRARAPASQNIARPDVGTSRGPRAAEQSRADAQTNEKLARQISTARRAGYSDDEIATHLSATDSRVRQAVEAGYSPGEVFAYLTRSRAPTGAKRAGADAYTAGILASSDRARTNQAQPEQGFVAQRGEDFAEPFVAGGDLVRAGKEQTRQGGAGNFLMGQGKEALGAFAQVMSPIAGTVNALTAPLARGFERAGIGDEASNNFNINALAMPLAPARAPASVATRAPQVSKAAKVLAKGKADPVAMRAKAAEFRSNAIEPALVDVIDDSGRGTVRAAASRNTPARQATTDFVDGRALDLPSRMSNQARRTVSSDPRAPREIATELAKGRKVQADQQFGAARGDVVQPTPEMVQAMRSEHARDAIAEAVRRERDPDVRRLLTGIRDQAFDDPAGMQLTVGAADRISRVLAGKADAAMRAGDSDLATTLGDLARDIRGPARDQSAGYADALKGYAAESRAMESAERGEDFLVRNTDEFVADVQTMDPREIELARATARRAIERKSGESVGAAPGVARGIATAPEQQARNAALLGPDGAQRLQSGMAAEERLVRNANDIAPRYGTQTQNKAQDAQALAGAMRTGVKGIRGDWLGVAEDWLKAQGMSDDLAEDIVTRAIDPAQTDIIIDEIEAALGSKAALQFLRSLNRPDLIAAGATRGSAAAQFPSQ